MGEGRVGNTDHWRELGRIGTRNCGVLLTIESNAQCNTTCFTLKKCYIFEGIDMLNLI